MTITVHFIDHPEYILRWCKLERLQHKIAKLRRISILRALLDAQQAEGVVLRRRYLVKLRGLDSEKEVDNDNLNNDIDGCTKQQINQRAAIPFKLQANLASLAAKRTTSRTCRVPAWNMGCEVKYFSFLGSTALAT